MNKREKLSNVCLPCIFTLGILAIMVIGIGAYKSVDIYAKYGVGAVMDLQQQKYSKK